MRPSRPDICIKCGRNPTENYETGWLPICTECREVVNLLPHDQFIAETSRLWGEFKRRYGSI